VAATLLAGCSPKPPETPPTPSPTPTPTLAPTPAPTSAPDAPPPDEPEYPKQILGKITLATTTSTDDSGLLDFILPVFTNLTGWEVDVIAVGLGAALQMGRDGEADVLLVHSRPDEDKFVEDGYADERYDVMYNDYVVLGPKGGSIAYSDDIGKAFKAIAGSGLSFVSRGDDSDVHMKEMSIWGAVDVSPDSNSKYTSAGQGMEATLGIAKETDAYTLSDRSTWLNYADKGNLEIICEGHPDLLNPYGVIPVSASVNAQINTEGAEAFVEWITGQTGQILIALFGLEEFGKSLFTPNA